MFTWRGPRVIVVIIIGVDVRIRAVRNGMLGSLASGCGHKSRKTRRGADDSLSFLALVSVLDPGIGAVGRVLAKLDPFLAQETKDTIGFYLANELVGTKGGSPLFSIATTGFMWWRWWWWWWWWWWMRVIEIGRGVLWRRTRGFRRFLAVCTMLEPLLDGL